MTENCSELLVSLLIRPLFDKASRSYIADEMWLINKAGQIA